MSFRDDASAKPTTYASAPILQRRKRLVAEAWRMLAEAGLEAFSVRELCQRASVSEGTFYNAFGSRDNIISTAVVEYAADVVGSNFVHQPSTLDGRIERLVRVQTRILRNRRYIAATMSVFWSGAPSSIVRTVMAERSRAANAPYIQALQRRRGLHPSVTPERLSEALMVVHYGLLSHWGAGESPDETLAKRATEDFLLVAGGATRGAAAREVEVWREDVAVDGPRWEDIKRLAADADESRAAQERIVATP